MCRFDVFAFCACLVAAPLSAMADSAENWGTPIGPDDLKGMASYAPGGGDLPPGSGTVAQGQQLYTEFCAYCHGDQLEGIPETGGARLIGGRGTLATDKPVKTVESYWPHAETLFDYVKRAMPFDQPGSLDDDQVYALTAFILSRGDILPEDASLDASSLSEVKMPNADGFYRGDIYDLRLSWGRAED